jgi:hypothetical protein
MADLVTAGQTAGGINDIVAVAEIMRRLMDEAEATLSRATGSMRSQLPRKIAAGMAFGEDAAGSGSLPRGRPQTIFN